jgi:hypothetical protein
MGTSLTSDFDPIRGSASLNLQFDGGLRQKPSDREEELVYPGAFVTEIRVLTLTGSCRDLIPPLLSDRRYLAAWVIGRTASLGKADFPVSG